MRATKTSTCTGILCIKPSIIHANNPDIKKLAKMNLNENF